MPAKTPKSKISPQKEKPDVRSSQTRWTRVVVGIFAVIIILTMVLSSVATNF